MVERIDHRAVVGAVTGRLHDDVARETQMIAQRKQLLLRRIAGRVFALRHIGKFGAGAEHMAMRIDGAGRHREVGL